MSMKVITTPSVGEIWRLQEKSPFPPKEANPCIRILDVKSGWVRYYQNSYFSDERMPLEMFLGVFEKSEAEAPNAAA